jgi:hypothetical protein
MKKLVLLLLFSGILKAQSISGVVKDKNNEALVGATVLLISDTLLIQGRFTDSLGQFNFEELKADQPYLLKVKSIGFSDYQSEEVKAPFPFLRIVLHDAEDIKLDEVIIKGKKPMIENEIDRTIVNVDAMPGGNTGNVYSLLEKTPGVSVANTTISLNGKQGVSILINGRPSNLSGKDLENYLKSLSASDIEKIELIENPPAKYDASGGAIINLKLRMNRQAGWTGSVNISHNAGKYWRNNDGLSLNYNLGKVHAYASGGYFNEQYQDVESRQTRFLKENYLVNQETENMSNSKGVSFHGGLDYFLSGKTTMGVFYRNSQPKVSSLRTIESNRESINPLTTVNNNLEAKTYDGASAYLTQKLGKRELSLEVNQVRYRNDATQNFENLDQDEFRYVLGTKIRTRSASLDYVHPIKRGNLEAGVKTTFMDNDNENTYQDFTESSYQTDWSKSNHFQYHENINAIYVSGQREFKRWSIKAGIRAETTRAEGIQLGNAEVPRSGFERTYANVFHNLFLNYKLDSAGKNTLTFVTQRRLLRPYYLYLNPFMLYRDPYNYSTGNPELNPQIQNRYEIIYRNRGKWTVAFHVNPFKDVILPTTQTIDTIFYTKNDNIAEGYMYMLAFGLNTQLTKWWNVNYTARLAHIGLRGKLYVENLDYSINVLRGELNNTFKVSDKMSVWHYVNYETKDYNGQTVTRARIRMNLGLQYKLMKNKASLNVSFDDVFHSWRNRNFSTNITNAYITSIAYSDTRRIGASLNYRFGNNKAVKKGKSSNANDDRI